MTRFYQGIVMATIILSAGIIGQIDAANEMEMKREMHAEALHQEAERQMTSSEMKTALAAMERNEQVP